MAFISKKMFSNAISNSLNNVLNSCYNVYVMQCQLHNIKPLSVDEFGNAVNNDLKIDQLKKQVKG